MDTPNVTGAGRYSKVPAERPFKGPVPKPVKKPKKDKFGREKKK